MSLGETDPADGVVVFENVGDLVVEFIGWETVAPIENECLETDVDRVKLFSDDGVTSEKVLVDESDRLLVTSLVADDVCVTVSVSAWVNPLFVDVGSGEKDHVGELDVVRDGVLVSDRFTLSDFEIEKLMSELSVSVTLKECCCDHELPVSE